MAHIGLRGGSQTGEKESVLVPRAGAIAQTGNRLAYASEVLKVQPRKVRLTDPRHAVGPARLIIPSAGFIGIASFSPDAKS